MASLAYCQNWSLGFDMGAPSVRPTSCCMLLSLEVAVWSRLLSLGKKQGDERRELRRPIRVSCRLVRPTGRLGRRVSANEAQGVGGAYGAESLSHFFCSPH